VSNEVTDLIDNFKRFVDKPFLIEDNFLLPVFNGLLVLITGNRFPQEDQTPIKLFREYST